MKSNIATKLLIVILYLLILVNICVTLKSKGILEVRINKSLIAMDDAIKGLRQPENGKDGKDGKDGYTPIKGVDYFDGKDSVSTHTIETIIKEVAVKGEDGADGYTPVKGVDYDDGLTPIIRCNESKDRWERRFSGSPSWTAILNEDNQPARCKIPSNN